MIEKIKKISNPLTIIAVFAGLAEVLGTIALIGVEQEIQHIFVWFVMLFPTIIVLLFFITLNFNPSVLYAPSDYENESNFLEVLKGKKAVDSSIKSLEEEVNKLSNSIDENITPKLEKLTDARKEEINQTLQAELAALRARVAGAKEAAENFSLRSLPYSALQSDMIDIISKSDKPVTAREISNKVNMSVATVSRALLKLVERGAIIKTDNGFVLNAL